VASVRGPTPLGYLAHMGPHRTSGRAASLALVLAALAALPAHALGPQDADDELFAAYIVRMERALAELQDATYVLHKRDRADGVYTEERVMDVRFRVPDDLYLAYSGEMEGRRILYKGAGWNGGKLRVDPGPLLPTLDLDIRGSIATEGERYTVREVRLSHPAATISRDCKLVRDHASWTPQVDDLGGRTITGRQARCFDTRSPKDQDASLYAYRTEMCFDEGTGFPIELKSWDIDGGSMKLVEWYRYDELRVNVGLTDADFDEGALGI
jgi:hypothetical protein